MFRIDKNNSIFITKGDTAEMDIRIFNKDWHTGREPLFKKPVMFPLLPIVDDEGHAVFDSEGYPIYPVDSEGRPVFPYDIDSEGHMVFPPIPVDSEGEPIVKWPMKPIHMPWKVFRHSWPRWKQIEEVIRPRDLVTFRVKDLNTGEIVLELYNDEFVNTIYFYSEDTEDLEPKQYLYQLSFEPLADADEYEMWETDKEKNTMITGLFEVVEKF